MRADVGKLPKGGKRQGRARSRLDTNAQENSRPLQHQQLAPLGSAKSGCATVPRHRLATPVPTASASTQLTGSDPRP